MNFDNVSEAGKGMTSPGTIDVFKISNVEFGNTPSGKKYMKTTFENKDSSFTHNFFLTEAALSRVQTLAKAAIGELLSGEVTDPQLKATFTNKTLGLKVIGRVSDSNGRAYPDLPFGGFAKPADKVGELEFSTRDMEAIAEAKAATADSSIAQADSETGNVPAGTGAPAATGDADDF